MTLKVGVVGATGLVGIEILKLMPQFLRKSEFTPVGFASRVRPGENILELASSWDELRRCDYVLSGATSEVALMLREHMRPNQFLIDNSSAFRMDPSVPLVVPDVNGDLLKARPPLVANPNCTAILLCVALAAFRKVGLNRVNVATYQAASGAGIKGLEELDRQHAALAKGEHVPKPEVFPFQLAGNVLSHNSSIRSGTSVGAGYNEEEWKVIEETRKILDVRHLPISATCIRVPVRRAHTEAVSVDLGEDLSLEAARELLRAAPGVKMVDDWESNHFPMPIESQDQDLVFVGRVRKDPSLAKTLHFMLSGDQLRKGAASNALQIMKALVDG